ncbi:hypothetical protein MTO96_048557 [Rhipicephalus appendiculatus]
MLPINGPREVFANVCRTPNSCAFHKAERPVVASNKTRDLVPVAQGAVTRGRRRSTPVSGVAPPPVAVRARWPKAHLLYKTHAVRTAAGPKGSRRPTRAAPPSQSGGHEEGKKFDGFAPFRPANRRRPEEQMVALGVPASPLGGPVRRRSGDNDPLRPRHGRRRQHAPEAGGSPRIERQAGSSAKESCMQASSESGNAERGERGRAGEPWAQAKCNTGPNRDSGPAEARAASEAQARVRRAVQKEPMRHLA